MSSAVSTLISKAGTAWCELMHDDIMWPVDGHYRCKICLREYPVEWNETGNAAAQTPAPVAVGASRRRIHSTASLTQRAA